MLNIQAMRVSHGKAEAVKGVSFQIAEKEAVFLIGPNGAGKSTCLNAICGVFKISSGSVNFCDERIDRMKPHIIARKGISLVPQGKRLFADQNVMDNLRLGYFPRCKGKEKEFERGAELVFDLFPVLKAKKEQLAGAMSGGEQQMLAIGRAIISSPKLLLFDELSMGLAPLIVDLVFESIDKLREMGTPMLIVEQLATKVFEIASRGYVMVLGEIVIEGPSKELSMNEEIRNAYFSQPQKVAT